MNDSADFSSVLYALCKDYYHEPSQELYDRICALLQNWLYERPTPDPRIGKYGIFWHGTTPISKIDIRKNGFFERLLAIENNKYLDSSAKPYDSFLPIDQVADALGL